MKYRFGEIRNVATGEAAQYDATGESLAVHDSCHGYSLVSNKPQRGADDTADSGSAVASVFLLRDAFLLAGLVVAAALVFWVDSRIEIPVVHTIAEEVPPTQPTEVVKMKLAVTPPEFDDMGTLLRGMGEGYENDQISLDDLLDADKLSRYDVVFFTCGTSPRHWLGDPKGADSRGAIMYDWNEDIRRQLKSSLRQFVESGGTLYASDWRLSALSSSFPEIIDQVDNERGDVQMVVAEVVDEGLRERLGAQEIKLKFDEPGWFPAVFSDKEQTVYLRSRYQTMEGRKISAPLLVKLLVGKGAIIFTSFHNEKQNSETEKELLEYLVLATVTARVDADVAGQMIRGGFSPRKKNLLSTSAGEPSVTKSYTHTKNGDLEFVLAFENRGAELELVVEGPNGTGISEKKTGSETVKIRITDAAEGTWKYTITAKKVPFPNFPFSCSVWEK